MLSAPQGSAGNGVGADEDPAAAFLAQQESEIAGIENDEGFSILDSGDVPSSLSQDQDGVFTRHDRERKKEEKYHYNLITDKTS